MFGYLLLNCAAISSQPAGMPIHRNRLPTPITVTRSASTTRVPRRLSISQELTPRHLTGCRVFGLAYAGESPSGGMRKLCAILRGLALAAGLTTSAAADPISVPIPDSTGPTPPWPQLLPALAVPNGVQPGPMPRCRDATIACVDDTLAIMQSLRDQLGCDHRVIFDTTYLLLTQAYRRTVVEEPHFFQDNRYLNYEDTLFANYYFDTLSRYAAGRPVPEAWRIALDAAGSGDADAAQDMLLGINAHVQRDMPYVVASLGMRLPDGSSRKPDHDAVNEILRNAYEPIVDEIAARYDPAVGVSNSQATPADNIGGLELVKEWREGVWRNAERLMNATSDEQRAQASQSIEQNAAVWARSILSFQNPPGYRATRDAYCSSKLAAAQQRSAQASPRTRAFTLRLSVKPRRTRAGHRTRFVFTAVATVPGSASSARARGVAIRFAGRRARTNPHGRATIVVKLRRRGRYTARATRAGLPPARAHVSVR